MRGVRGSPCAVLTPRAEFPVRLVLNSAASKEIEWHCKHYEGRGLMKKFSSGDALAKEIGISAEQLKATYDDYNEIADGKKKCPFNKKFFSNGPWKMDDSLYVAQMTPVLHYTMGGIEANEHAQVIDTSGKVVPGLFASGEAVGGVHGANRLGGSSLLGCVVFGRVAGDSASAYLMSQFASGQASARAGQVAQHLETTVRVDPATQKLNLTFSWAGQQDATPQAAQSAPAQQSQQAQAQGEASAGPGEKTNGKGADKNKKYTLDDVAKHNTEDDCWIAVNGQVLDVTNFMDDHPGTCPRGCAHLSSG